MARYRVEVSSHVDAKLARVFGLDRTIDGGPSIFDVESGALAAAIIQFRHFDGLPEVVGPSIRVATVIDPFVGALTFTGVLMGSTVEIADVDIDPDYWSAVSDAPDI